MRIAPTVDLKNANIVLDSKLLLLDCFQLPKPAEPDRQIARYMIILRALNHYHSLHWLLFNKQYNLTSIKDMLPRRNILNVASSGIQASGLITRPCKLINASANARSNVSWQAMGRWKINVRLTGRV